jgi:asparagine synthase (glutamine-hydrolysing)
MHEMLAHRGPDGEGYLWLDRDLGPCSVHGRRIAAPAIPDSARVGAAFRWLKIQDLDSVSAQPMSNAARTHWILFNGEIYNHRALRSELLSLGESFRTQSDTEVALVAYQRWGSEAFARFHGMWGMVLLDLSKREVILSRDRLGIKPLYYSLQRSRLILASEPQAIALSGEQQPRAELFRVHEFLRGLPPQSENLSFFRDISPFPAGCWGRVSLDRDIGSELTVHRYWKLEDFEAEDLPESAFQRKQEEFELLLTDALESHSDAAVDVGALLSGGMDTSILARLLAAHAAGKRAAAPRTFSVIFEDPRMSEWPYMQLVLAKGGLKGHNCVLSADTAWETAARVIEAQGQPLLGQDTIAQFHAYKLAREHNTNVVIEGQGSDELFAGMPLYEAQIFPQLLRSGRWIQYALELRARMRRYSMSLRQALSVYLIAPYRIRRLENRGLPAYAWLDAEAIDSTRFGPGRSNDWGRDRSAVNRFLYRHVRHTNLPAVLMYQDRSSMSHGVESRVPFLDHRLVEFAFRLPERFKVFWGIRKRILLETARKYLPEAVVERRDKRIFISHTGWMDLRRRRAPQLREMAASPELRNFGLLRPACMVSFVEDFLAAKHQDEMAIWRLYTLWHWIRRFRPAL